MTMIAAAPDLAELVRSTHPVGPESMGAFAMVLVAIVSVVLMVVVWAVFIRKPSRGRRRERGRLTSEAPAKPRDDAQGQRRPGRTRSADVYASPLVCRSSSGLRGLETFSVPEVK